MKSWLRSLIILLPLTVSACSTIAPKPTATPWPALGDASLGGSAYADMNGNGRVDITDPPIEGVKITLIFPSGQQLHENTDASGFAIINFPYTSDKMPDKMIMIAQPPEIGGYKLITPEQVTVQCCNGGAEFLFAPPVKSMTEYRAALPQSAQDIKEEADARTYYLKAQINQSDLTSITQHLSLSLNAPTGEYADCTGLISWALPPDAPAWWDPSSDTKSTYVKYDRKEFGIAVLAKLENGYLYLLMTRWSECQ